MALRLAELYERAAQCRAAAATEVLENVRQVHLQAADRWEMLAASERFKADLDKIEVCRIPDDFRPRAVPLPNDPVIQPIVAAEEAVAPQADAMADEGSEAILLVSPARPETLLFYGEDGNLRTLEEIEADVIRLAMQVYQGSISETARRLGIGRSTLYRKLDGLGIEHVA